jgi:hypothetical protein
MEAGVIWAITEAELSHQNLKNLMNSFILSFFLSFFLRFQKCPAKQKLRSTLLTSFLSPRSRNARPPSTGLNTSIGFQLRNSLFPFLSLPFPSTPAAAGRMAMRLGL